jgi:hypothetical protein
LRLGKRTRRRGAIEKSVAFAKARAARIAAGPPLPRTGAPPRPLPLRPGRVASLSAGAPWEARARPTPRGFELVVVHAEGRFLGGSYELCERARRQVEAPLLVSDVFLGEAAIGRAWRAGADAISPIVCASERAGVPLASLAAAARALGLGFAPEVATLDELESARDLGCRLVLVSLRDRDSLRPSLDAVAPLFDVPGLVMVALFADTLSGDEGARAAALAEHERATLTTETWLETPA